MNPPPNWVKLRGREFEEVVPWDELRRRAATERPNENEATDR